MLNDSTLTVTEVAPKLEANNKVVVSAEQRQKIGANNFDNVMRDHPLVGATGGFSGSSLGKLLLVGSVEMRVTIHAPSRQENISVFSHREMGE